MQIFKEIFADIHKDLHEFESKNKWQLREEFQKSSIKSQISLTQVSKVSSWMLAIMLIIMNTLIRPESIDTITLFL